VGALQAKLPEGTSLTRYKVSTEGRRVVVRDQGTAWIPESGQILLDFNLETSKSVEETGTDESADLTSAEAWFVQGCEWEIEDIDQAKHAYTQALTLLPSHTGARINLGRIFHEEGQLPQAIAQYQQALRWAPDSAIAAYNLGIALEDVDDIPAAVQAYETAVRLDENLEDAHYNLAQLYEKIGQQMKALGHLKAYHRLTQDA
jgi:tetratricopeptide (TPR) repeat protein